MKTANISFEIPIELFAKIQKLMEIENKSMDYYLTEALKISLGETNEN